ncbi:MAG: glycosyltransferase family 39 protein [Candidatus Eisenbacteria bacterium]
MARMQPGLNLSLRAPALSASSLLLVLIPMLGAALRVLHIRHGLPDLTEEAFPFRHALSMWGADGSSPDLNPHWFAYSSLSLYLNYFLQRIAFWCSGSDQPADFLLRLTMDPTQAVIASRGLSILADAVTIGIVGRLTIAYGKVPAAVAMAFVALAPWMIETSRLIFADSLMTMFAMAALQQLDRFQSDRQGRHLMFSAMLIGLAIGTKYPAVILFLPMMLVAPQEYLHAGGRRRRAIAVGVACVAAVATTPYAVLSWGEVARDLTYMLDTTTGGGLGHTSGLSFGFYLSGTVANLGVLGTLLLLISVILCLTPTATNTTRLLGLAWLAAFLPTALSPTQAHRYLVPALAIGSCLTSAALRLASPSHGSFRGARYFGFFLPLIVLLQPLLNGSRAALSGAMTTQRLATEWAHTHLGDRDLVVSEAYGPTLLTHETRSLMISSPVFRAASPQAQGGYLKQRAYHLVWMPLLSGGYTSVVLPRDARTPVEVYPHAVDWNAAAYDIRLLRGVDYFITTSAVRGRFDADTLRFHEQRRFYAFLERHAMAVAQFGSTSNIEGPRITVYRLTARTQADLAATAGPLAVDWWTRTVPASFRALATERKNAPLAVTTGAELPGWAFALRAAYAQRYSPFAFSLAQHLAAVGRFEPSEQLLRAGLAILPDDIDAALLYAQVAGSLAHWSDVETVLERSTALLTPAEGVPPELALALANAHLANSRPTQALQVLGAPSLRDASMYATDVEALAARARYMLKAPSRGYSRAPTSPRR